MLNVVKMVVIIGVIVTTLHCKVMLLNACIVLMPIRYTLSQVPISCYTVV